jgi:hypothetical protein
MLSRLKEFKIEGLFGLYDHSIRLNLLERITIVIGPNGRGKTVCLKFIEAMFRNRYSYFFDIPFRVATFSFNDGQSIEVRRSEDGEYPSVVFVLRPGNGTDTSVNWTPAIPNGPLIREIRRHLPPQWQYVGPDKWVDETDGEELSLEELTERYRFPAKLLASVSQSLPDEFASLISRTDCHLIETQRLLVLQGGGSPAHDFEYNQRRRSRDSRLAIQQKAQKLQAILKDTLTTYANLSQSLDSTFPLRVFEAQYQANLTQDELRQALTQLNERRAALMAAGIMDLDSKEVTLTGGNIERGVAMALEIYVEDASQKLDVFNNLRSRLDLFKDLIDKRFIDKSIQIDRELGLE